MTKKSKVDLWMDGHAQDIPLDHGILRYAFWRTAARFSDAGLRAMVSEHFAKHQTTRGFRYLFGDLISSTTEVTPTAGSRAIFRFSCNRKRIDVKGLLAALRADGFDIVQVEEEPGGRTGWKSVNVSVSLPAPTGTFFATPIGEGATMTAPWWPKRLVLRTEKEQLRGCAFYPPRAGESSGATSVFLGARSMAGGPMTWTERVLETGAVHTAEATLDPGSGRLVVTRTMPDVSGAKVQEFSLVPLAHDVLVKASNLEEMFQTDSLERLTIPAALRRRYRVLPPRKKASGKG